MPAQFSLNQLDTALLTLNSGLQKPWQIVDGKLHKTFMFRDFIQAFAFMTAAALQAEKMNHHPEWCNVYKTVVIDLTTHESGGITEKDFVLAGKFEMLAAAETPQ